MAGEGSIVVSLVTGRSSQRSWTFGKGEPVEVDLGSDSSRAWQLDGEGVAGLHAWFRWDGARLSIAATGTAATVDGAEVRGWTAVGDGARVRLGDVELFAQSMESDALLRSTRRVVPGEDDFSRETARVVPDEVDLAATIVESARATAAVVAPEPSSSMADTILEPAELEADETWAWQAGTEPETSDPRPAADVASVAETVPGANIVPLSEAETFPPVLAAPQPGSTVAARPASQRAAASIDSAATIARPPAADDPSARTTPRVPSVAAEEAARTMPRAPAPPGRAPGASTLGRAATLAAPGTSDPEAPEAETIIRVDGDDVEPFVETLIHPGALREPSRPGQAKIVTPPPVMPNQLTQDLPEEAKEAALRTLIAPVERRGPVPPPEHEAKPVVAVPTPDPRRQRRRRGELTPTDHDARIVRKPAPAVGKGRAFLLGGAVAIASFLIAASVVVMVRSHRSRPPAAPPLPAVEPPAAPAAPPPGPGTAPPDAAPPATPPTPSSITPSTSVQQPPVAPAPPAPPSTAPPPSTGGPSPSPPVSRGQGEEPDLTAQVRVAAGHVISGRHTEALAAYEQLARLDPANPVYPEAAHILRRKIEARSVARAAGVQR